MNSETSEFRVKFELDSELRQRPCGVALLFPVVKLAYRNRCHATGPGAEPATTIRQLNTQLGTLVALSGPGCRHCFIPVTSSTPGVRSLLFGYYFNNLKNIIYFLL